MDSTQFIRLAPGELLPEDEPSASPAFPSLSGFPSLPARSASAASRRPLALAVLLGLLAGVLLILILLGLSHARH